MPSAHKQILAAVADVVTDMNLRWDGQPVVVEQRKKLGVADGFAGSPVLVVAPTSAEKSEVALGGLTYWITYEATVALISAGGLDLSGLTGDLAAGLDWRDSLVRTLSDPTVLGLSPNFVASTRAEYDPPLDGARIEKGQDVSAVRFWFRCLIQAGVGP